MIMMKRGKMISLLICISKSINSRKKIDDKEIPMHIGEKQLNDPETTATSALLAITFCNCVLALAMIACGMSIYIGMPLAAVIVACIVWYTKRKLVGKEKLWKSPTKQN